MGSVYVIGDTHGELEVDKIISTKNEVLQNLNKDDFVIVLGDFGLILNDSKKEIQLLNKLNNCKFTTLWIDGNHENFDLLKKYPIEQWKGGKIRKISNSIFHLMRGEIFIIEDKKIFTFGGAKSIDKCYRVEGVSWWKEELPSDLEMKNGMENLSNHQFKVDFILTHTCSKSTFDYISQKERFWSKDIDCLMEYLQLIKENVKYKEWYFGHFHVDYKINDKEVAVYDKLIKII